MNTESNTANADTVTSNIFPASNTIAMTTSNATSISTTDTISTTFCIKQITTACTTLTTITTSISNDIDSSAEHLNMKARYQHSW